MGLLTNMEQRRIVFTAVGDTKCSDDAKLTFKNIANEKPDVKLFLGDYSYWNQITLRIQSMRNILST
jgi:hypothetical protein